MSNNMERKLSLSTHILDLSSGKPAEGIKIKLYKIVNNSWMQSNDEGITDANGRYKNFQNVETSIEGTYKIRFETKEYFNRLQLETLFPYIEITFDIKSPEHYHIPLLMSAFSYSTYRGS